MIVYSRITPEDSSAVAQHMLKGFYMHEPFGLALGLTIDQVDSWFPSFLEQILHYNEPVSFLARDTDTNEIVGCIINIIFDDKRAPPPSMKQFLVKEKQPIKWQIIQFLEDLEEGVDAVKELKMDSSQDNKILTCLFVSVYPEYGGKGIAKTLIRESEKDVRENLKEVTIAMTDVTSQFSYLAFQKHGYHCMKEVKYLDYKDPDGVPIFEGKEKELGVHTYARVMVKKL